MGKTDAEAEGPIVWPPDVKNWLIRKDPNAGKDWRQEEKRMTKDEMVGWHHRLNGHELGQTSGGWRTGKPGMLQSMGLQGVGHDWATELTQWNLSKIQEIVEDRGAWCAAVRGVSKSHTWLSNWTDLNCISDSFADPEGYSISSKAFLPTVVDILATWFTFAHSHPF